MGARVASRMEAGDSLGSQGRQGNLIPEHKFGYIPLRAVLKDGLEELPHLVQRQGDKANHANEA
jgi:hypothetical protein